MVPKYEYDGKIIQNYVYLEVLVGFTILLNIYSYYEVLDDF